MFTREPARRTRHGKTRHQPSPPKDGRRNAHSIDVDLALAYTVSCFLDHGQLGREFGRGDYSPVFQDGAFRRGEGALPLAIVEESQKYLARCTRVQGHNTTPLEREADRARTLDVLETDSLSPGWSHQHHRFLRPLRKLLHQGPRDAKQPRLHL